MLIHSLLVVATFSGVIAHAEGLDVNNSNINNIEVAIDNNMNAPHNNVIIDFVNAAIKDDDEEVAEPIIAKAYVSSATSASYYSSSSSPRASSLVNTVSLDYNLHVSDRGPDQWPSRPHHTSLDIASFDYDDARGSSSSASSSRVSSYYSESSIATTTVRKHHHQGDHDHGYGHGHSNDSSSSTISSSSSSLIRTVSLDYNLHVSDNPGPDEWPSRPRHTSRNIASFDYDVEASSTATRSSSAYNRYSSSSLSSSSDSSEYLYGSSSSSEPTSTARKHHHGNHHGSNESSSSSSGQSVYPEVTSYRHVSHDSGPHPWPTPDLKESVYSEPSSSSSRRGYSSSSARRDYSSSGVRRASSSAYNDYYSSSVVTVRPGSSCAATAAASSDGGYVMSYVTSYRVSPSYVTFYESGGSSILYSTVTVSDGSLISGYGSDSSGSWVTVSDSCSFDDTNGSEAHIPEDLIISSYTEGSLVSRITAYAVTTVGTSGTTWITSGFGPGRRVGTSGTTWITTAGSGGGSLAYSLYGTSGTTWITSRRRHHHHRATGSMTDASLSVLPSSEIDSSSSDDSSSLDSLGPTDAANDNCLDLSAMPYRPTYHVLESDELLFSILPTEEAWSSASPGDSDYSYVTSGSGDYDSDDDDYTTGDDDDEDDTSFQESSYDSYDSEFDGPGRSTFTTTAAASTSTIPTVRTRRTSITESYTKDGRCQTMTVTATVRSKNVFITVPTAIRAQQRSSKLFKHKAYNALFFHLRSVLEMCECTKVDVLPQPDHREGSVIEVVGYKPDGSACYEEIERRAIVIANMFDHVHADFFRSANDVLMIRLRRVKEKHRYPLHCPVTKAGGIHCSDLGLLYSKRNCPSGPQCSTALTTGRRF